MLAIVVPRRLPYILLVFWFAACGEEATQPPPVDELFAPASPPKVYAAFAELAPLFAQRNDTTYLVNFWATWCAPCLEELPLLETLAREEKSAPLRVLLVSLDTDPAAVVRIPGYLKKHNIALPTVVLQDTSRQWMQSLDRHWQGQLPTTFIYRNDLKYTYRRPFATLPDLRQAVAPLLSR